MGTVTLEVAESGAGAPVLLLHAFPLSAALWDDVRPALTAEHRVITPDLRGFGASPYAGEAEPSLDAMAGDVLALLDRLGLDRVVLGGLSMGGYVAMALLRRAPERVGALILADTKAGADPDPAREKRLRIAAHLDAEQRPDVLVEEVLPGLLGDTTKAQRPAVVARVESWLRSCRPEAAAYAQRAMAARPDSHDTLGGIDLPVLIVRGAEDGLSTEQDVADMAAALPKAQLMTIPGAGHLTCVEAPGDFAEALLGFLRAVA